MTKLCKYISRRQVISDLLVTANISIVSTFAFFGAGAGNLDPQTVKELDI